MSKKDPTKQELEVEKTMFQDLKKIVYNKKRTLEEANKLIDYHEQTLACAIAHDIQQSEFCIRNFFKDEKKVPK